MISASLNAHRILQNNKELAFSNCFGHLNPTNAKKDFVVSKIKEKKTRKYIDEGNEDQKKKRKRDVHRSYAFDIDGSKINVCKKFFKKPWILMMLTLIMLYKTSLVVYILAVINGGDMLGTIKQVTKH